MSFNLIIVRSGHYYMNTAPITSQTSTNTNHICTLSSVFPPLLLFPFPIAPTFGLLPFPSLAAPIKPALLAVGSALSTVPLTAPCTFDWNSPATLPLGKNSQTTNQPLTPCFSPQFVRPQPSCALFFHTSWVNLAARARERMCRSTFIVISEKSMDNSCVGRFHDSIADVAFAWFAAKFSPKGPFYLSMINICPALWPKIVGYTY
jgi:hypothetical protein